MMDTLIPRPKTPEAPFSWENKTARRKIREVLISEDRSCEISSRLSLYAALCEESSNKGGGASFVISQKILGDMAGLSPKSTGLATLDLVRIGVIAVDNPAHGGRGMKTYHLLSLPSVVTTERSVVTTQRYEVDAGQAPLPTTEESREEHSEESTEPPLSRDAVPFKFMEEWNALGNVSQIHDFGKIRIRDFRTRMKDRFFRENYREALNRIAASDFCTGQNNRGWRASVDWFLRPGKVAHILEGNFDNKTMATRDISL